jgi:predicted DNA-binding transcriptional regulator YafY
MPKNKNAAIRYRIIDKMLRNKFRPYPTKEDLLNAILEHTDGTLDVSASTLEKDIVAMKSPDLFNAPIEYNRTHGGYEYTDKDFSIDGIPLNDDEISAIEFAAGILKQFQGTEFMQEYESAIEKIFAKINVRKNPEIETVIQIEKAPTRTGSEFISPLIQFILERCAVQFEYKKFSTDRSKIYTVHPYLIKEYRNRWYLIGLEDLSKEIRTFGLERMTVLNIASGIKFIKDPAFNAESYFKHALGITIFNNQQPEEIELSFSPEVAQYIESQPWHESQQEIAKNEREYRIKLKLMPSMELVRQVLSYGNQVKVIKSEWLKREVEGKR